MSYNNSAISLGLTLRLSVHQQVTTATKGDSKRKKAALINEVPSEKVMINEVPSNRLVDSCNARPGIGDRDAVVTHSQPYWAVW